MLIIIKCVIKTFRILKTKTLLWKFIFIYFFTIKIYYKKIFNMQKILKLINLSEELNIKFILIVSLHFIMTTL